MVRVTHARLPTMRNLLLSAVPLLVMALPGQDPPPNRTLTDLERAFEEQRIALMQAPGNQMQNFRNMIGRHIAEVEEFLAHEARGNDRFNGRLMLVDMHMSLAQMDEAKSALLKMDAEESPAMILLVAAGFADQLGLGDQRGAWIDTALAKNTDFEEHMEVARMLMTRLVEVERAQAIFDSAMADAQDDEQRAKVLWFQSLATREREDLAEGAYFEALEELGEKYPDTYYGGIAVDRGVAAEFRVGGRPVPFTVNDLNGVAVSLSDYQGKVLLLYFWVSWLPACRELNAALTVLSATHKEQGLEILGISLDGNRQALDQAIAVDGCTWPQIYDGRMWQSDLALRYIVEALPHLMVIGRDGTIAAMNIYAEDPESIREFSDLVAGIVEKGGE